MIKRNDILKDLALHQKFIPLDITLPSRIVMSLISKRRAFLRFSEVKVTKHRASIMLGKRKEETVYYFGIGIDSENLYIFCSLNKQCKEMLDWLSRSYKDVKKHLGDDVDVVARPYTVEIRRTLVEHRKRKHISSIEFRRIVNELDRWIKYVKDELDKAGRDKRE